MDGGANDNLLHIIIELNLFVFYSYDSWTDYIVKPVATMYTQQKSPMPLRPWHLCTLVYDVWYLAFLT